LKKALLGLPYIFSDPFEPKIRTNPKKLSYGSKVDAASRPREQYFTVESVEAPDLLKLKNGPLVHLAGVVPQPETAGAAMDFLRLKTSKTRVFLRLESPESDSLKPGQKVQAYVYLKNRTFLNAHLIKRGLAGVDSFSEYSKKGRFMKLALQADPGPEKEA
jgi:site-specific DNA-methyltransferase (adenine-specific)